MKKNKILFIEDDIVDQMAIKKLAKDKDFPYRFTIAPSLAETKKILKIEKFDIIISDYLLGDGTAFDVFELAQDIPIIFTTGAGDEELAVKAMKTGAYDYFTKPINVEELKITIRNALLTKSLQKEVSTLKSQLEVKQEFDKIVGESSRIKQVIKQVNIVAPTNMTVVLQGDSGTGKELLAHLIHQMSDRKDKPYIAIDCGAIPDTLVESELFGYEKGAFTGANAKKSGKFETANRGTIFLDEITNLPSIAQAKLLRVIQERKVQRIGSTESIDIDVRIITATNLNFSQSVKQGKFRQDLYHRLNEFHILIPSLCDRKDDIPLLANYFLKKSNEELKKKVKGFSSDSSKLLLNYNWPGNVREFKNVVKRAVLLTEGEFIESHNIVLENSESTEHVESLSFFHDFGSEFSLKETTMKVSKQVEKDIIQKALVQAGGNKSKTAKILKVNRMTLYSKLKEFNLE